VHGDAALIPAILAFVALLVVFDYVANDGDIVREVLVWLIRTGRNVAGVIHQLVMSFFGE
jgi:hypothetical protein